ncbi:hypothetical protein ACFL0R_04770 [Pseudomonadota bacterium]
MTLGLHEQCINRLKERLADALAQASVRNMMILNRDALSGVLDLESILPTTGTTKYELEKYIGESPLFDFIYGQLSKELYELQEYNSDVPNETLSNIPDYSNLGDVSESLINRFESLPWNYKFTFSIGNQVTKYIKSERIDISEDIAILKGGDILKGSFPLQSGIPGRDQDLHGGGLLSLAFGGMPKEWDEDCLYVQINGEGYIGKWITTTPQHNAIDTLKSLLGLLIAMRTIRVENSYSTSKSISRCYIHRDLEGNWEVDDSFELDSDVGKTIFDLRVDDLNGALDSEDKIAGFIGHSLNLVAKALAKNNDAEKIRLSGRWLFDSYCGKNELLSFIQTTVALEILLGEKAISDLMGLGELLRNRCAYLIGKNHQQREEVLQDFKKIYDIRSKIVHRGKSRLSRNDRELFYKLQWMVNRVIQEEIELVGKNA